MSYRLFRRRYRDRRTGEIAERGKSYSEFRDHVDARRRWPLYADERRSRQLAERLVRLAECRRHGERPDEGLARWVAAAPPALRAKLAAADLIDPEHSAKGGLLVAHLEGDTDPAGAVTMPGWRQALLARGSSDRGHVGQTVKRVRRVFDESGFITWPDLCRAGGAARVALFLATLRAKPGKDGINGTTFNAYVSALRGFCRWMVKTSRATHNPLAILERVRDAETDKRDRRELAVEEVRRLCRTAAVGPVRLGLDGPERVRL